MCIAYILDHGRLDFLICAVLAVLQLYVTNALKLVLTGLCGSLTCKSESHCCLHNFPLHLHLCLCRLSHCFELGEFFQAKSLSFYCEYVESIASCILPGRTFFPLES